MAMLPYGDATIERLPDGRLRVTRADEVIGIDVEMLVEVSKGDGPRALYADPDGNLVMCGQVGYAPIGFAPDSTGAARVVICRRVWGHVDSAG